MDFLEATCKLSLRYGDEHTFVRRTMTQIHIISLPSVILKHSIVRYIDTGLEITKDLFTEVLSTVGERIYMMLKIRDLMTGWNLCWMKTIWIVLERGMKKCLLR